GMSPRNPREKRTPDTIQTTAHPAKQVRPKFHNQLGLARRCGGDFEAARPAYEEAGRSAEEWVKRDGHAPAAPPSLGASCLGLGWIEFNLDRPEQALPHFDRAVGFFEPGRGAASPEVRSRSLAGLKDALRGKLQSLEALGRETDARAVAVEISRIES